MANAFGQTKIEKRENRGSGVQMRNTVKLNFFGCSLCLACVSMTYHLGFGVVFLFFGLSLHGKKSDNVQKKKMKKGRKE